MSPTTAVILAAGTGSRLGVASKPLAIVGGITLLERAVALASDSGIARIVVVVDSADGAVAAFCAARIPEVEVVCAPDHWRGNGASAAAGLRHAGGRCLVMMVDHLHEPASVRKLLEHPGDFVVAIDSAPRYVDHDEATCVRLGDRGVVAIDKNLSEHDAVETGLIACPAETVAALARTANDELEFNQLKNAWLQSGQRIDAVDIAGAFWIDVDTPRDRRWAAREMLKRDGAKQADGPVARRINRPLSRVVSARLLLTAVAPNVITVANLALLLLSAALLALGTMHGWLLIAGGLFVQVSSALDGVDGEIARVSGRTSERGAVLDAVCDRYGDLAIIIGATIAADTPAAWPWAIAAIAANWQLSFLRREHERIVGTLPSSHVRWQWSRDVRLLALALACMAMQPLAGLVAGAVIGNLDALRRLVALLRLRPVRSEAVTASPDPPVTLASTATTAGPAS